MKGGHDGRASTAGREKPNTKGRFVVKDCVTPNFLIIGAPKAGTTSLWALLREHPEVYMPEAKEPAFFSFDEVYARGWSWYTSLFEMGRGHRAIGEATPNYSHELRAVPRIAQHLPDARLIYIVRHPLRCIESAFKQCLYTQHPMPTQFRRAVREYKKLVNGSRYWRNLQAYREHYSDERILLLFFEDFVADPQATLHRCFAFLDIDTEVTIAGAGQAHNPSAGKTAINDMARRVKRLPGAVAAWRALPVKVRAMFDPVTRAPVPERIVWDEATWQWVMDELADDAQRTLAYGQKSADYWDLSFPGEPGDIAAMC